ncbi:MAG: phospholipase C, phosphocholine-specific [Rudaea sp.]
MAASIAVATLRADWPRAEFMVRLSRREFLGLSAAAAGVAATAKLPSAMRSAMAMAPRSSSASAIRHVVVLMQENRSFDHYFGTLPGVRGFADRAALKRSDGSTVFDQPSDDGGFIRPFLHGTPTAISDLDHSWHGTHAAWNAGRYDRWVAAKGAASMAHLDRSAIPYHFALADAFTICDNYFCSVMGATNPNRLYLWSGTCDPNGETGGPAIDNTATDFRWTTYPERLQAAGVDWKIYQNAADNYDDNALAWFSAFKQAQPGTALFERGMASVPAISGDTCSDIIAELERDVQSGTLPFASWIIAPETCSEHPSHSPEKGAHFIARVLAALTADPDVWASTVLLINYDENDGFFDHVPPPVAPRGTPDEFIDDAPIGLGPRVPMIIASPWSRGGYVCSQVFDHTSVIRLMEELTGVAEPNISAWRRQTCGDLLSAFDFTATLVALSPAATRPARALPYQPNARIGIDRDQSALELVLENGGSESVHFAVYSGDDVPRRYDVVSNEPVVDIFLAGETYSLAVHGPNGFVREFDGDISTDVVEASCEYVVQGHSSRLRLTLSNGSSDARSAVVDASAYGLGSIETVDIAPNSNATIEWNVERTTRGWYDVIVTRPDDLTFRRRLAGHIETGFASVSG